MSIAITRRIFTVDEYHEMARAGILTAGDRVELLEGEIVQMSPIGSHHAACVNRLNRFFTMRLQNKAIVSVQNPVQLSKYSEPEPDIALLKPRSDFYLNGHPKPKDVFLLIEVAESSSSIDREVKIPLYAKAGIEEVWLIDLDGQRVEVYRSSSENSYTEVQKLSKTQQLSPLAFPDVLFDLQQLF